MHRGVLQRLRDLGEVQVAGADQFMASLPDDLPQVTVAVIDTGADMDHPFLEGRLLDNGWDIVEGPMADDTIWDYIEDFLAGEITREAFWVLVKFKYPTHPIVFCTARALGTLTYERSYSL